MPKEVVLQQCDYCRKTAKRVSTIEHHEKICINNPNGINCFLCVHQEYGIFYIDRWDGARMKRNFISVQSMRFLAIEIWRLNVIGLKGASGDFRRKNDVDTEVMVWMKR